MGRVTIKDIANRLGISASTVSRALNNHPDINEKTRQDVVQTAQSLDYYPDILAQGLKSRKTNTIGIIVPEIRHDFFASVISGIEAVACEKDYAIMVCQSNESYRRELLNLRSLISNRVAGILVSISQETEDVSHFNILHHHKIPVVFFDRSHRDITGSQVLVNDYEGAVQMVNYLLSRGYRRIAHIAGPQYVSVGRERLRGYADALASANIRFDENLVVRYGLKEEDGMRAIEQLLNQTPWPDAVFAVNDPVAFGVFRVLKERGIKIPEQMAIAGFSNNPVMAYVEPSVTTVHQPAYEIGTTAARMLLQEIKSPREESKFRIKTLKTELVIRDSA